MFGGWCVCGATLGRMSVLAARRHVTNPRTMPSYTAQHGNGYPGSRVGWEAGEEDADDEFGDGVEEELIRLEGGCFVV